MIIGIEVAMALMGLFALVAGRFPISNDRVVRGAPARCLGLICFLPVPVTLGLAFCLGLVPAVLGVRNPPKGTWDLIGIVLEAIVALGTAGLVALFGYRLSDPSRAGKPQFAGFEPYVVGSATHGDWVDFGSPSAGRRMAAWVGLGGVCLILAGVLVFRFWPGAEEPRAPQPAFVPTPRANAADPPRKPTPRPAAPDSSALADVPKSPRRGVDARNLARSKAPGASKGRVPAATKASPAATGGTLAEKSRTVDDLKVTDLKMKADAVVPCLFWSADGESFFLVETKGMLRRVALDGFVEEMSWDTGQSVAWLSPSAEGLVLTSEGRQEAWLIDPNTFERKRVIEIASAVRVVSAPRLSVAFGTNRGGSELSVIDLKAGEVVRQYDARSFEGVHAGFDKLAVTPDGKYLLAQGGVESLIRYAIKGDELEFEEASPRIAQNGQSVQVSPDSYYVALPSGGGNYEAGPYGTFVFKVADLSKPEIRIMQGAYPRTIGFDTKAGYLYAQNRENWLILFRPSGAEARAYPSTGRRARAGETRQFAVHPDGGKLLVLGGSTLSFVELPAK